MTEKSLIPLALEAASQCLIDPVTTPGELVGGVLGSAYGPFGAFVGGTVGRMLEKKFTE